MRQLNIALSFAVHRAERHLTSFGAFWFFPHDYGVPPPFRKGAGGASSRRTGLRMLRSLSPSPSATYLNDSGPYFPNISSISCALLDATYLGVFKAGTGGTSTIAKRQNGLVWLYVLGVVLDIRDTISHQGEFPLFKQGPYLSMFRSYSPPWAASKS